MDIAVISLIMSSVTAIIAVIGPIVSSIITQKSNEKTKYIEIHSPRVYDAVRQMLSAYSTLIRAYFNPGDTCANESDRSRALNSLRNELKSACYGVMAVVPNDKIHRQVIDFVESLDRNDEWLEGATFQQLLTAITLESSPYVSKKQRGKRKSKRASSK